MQIFLDSSVILAAIGSITGGSSRLFYLQNLGKVKIVSSGLVMWEVEKNVRKKFSEIHLDRFFMLASQIHVLLKYPNEELIERAKKIIIDKDAPILADAKTNKADILVTLDKKDMLQPKVRKFMYPVKVMTPGEVIRMLEDS